MDRVALTERTNNPIVLHRWGLDAFESNEVASLGDTTGMVGREKTRCLGTEYGVRELLHQKLTSTLANKPYQDTMA